MIALILVRPLQVKHSVPSGAKVFKFSKEKSLMKLRFACVVVGFLSLALSLAPRTVAQTSTQTASALPRLVRFGGTAKDLNGNPLTGVVGITFAIYSEQTGGASLWLETQNVTADSNGHYTVLLGSTKPDGLPADLFTSEQAHWVGVQVSGQAEQPRVLLVSAPYALKAGDAETIGGLPPSAFVLAAPVVIGSAAASSASASTAGSVSPATALDVTTTGGTINFLPLFNGTSTILDSVVFQSGTGTTAKIGINTTTPASTLDVKGTGTIRGILSLPATGTATAAKGANSQPLNLVASAFNTTAAVNQTFQWQAEPAGNDTATPSGTLNLLFGAGATKPSETGLHIARDGLITFATGQTFPGGGGGTITGVTAGTDLTGGGTSGNVTLNLNTANIPLLASANTFTGNQTVNGIFSASSNAFGVTGTAKATSGIGVGVGGTASSPAGYGVEGVNTATSGGAGVYGSSAASAGYGVEGINTSGNGTGVYGTAAHFGVQGIATGSGSTVGVYGNGVDGLQGSGTLHGVYAAGTGAGSMGVYGTSPGYGLYGVATNTTGTSFGVYGSGGSNGVYGTASNFGLYGVATATSGNSVGVFGTGIDGLQGSGSAYGVYAAASASGSTGVYGTAPQFGIYGVATGSVNTVGVFGSGVDGLQGSGTVHGVYANGGQYGVESFTSAGTAGTYGVFQGASTTGATYGVFPSGVWADTNSDGELAAGAIGALLATADNDLAGEFVNNSIYFTLVAINNGSGGTGDVIHAEGTGGSCTLTGNGDTSCTGVLKSVVATARSGGPQRVETYAVQSAENWFEDAGTAQLVNGAGRVNLESVFGQTVNTGVEYHVFLTPDGDCKGLYVSAKTGSGFEVRELGGGTSSVAFDYRIMAKRVGYESVRLADVTERFNQQEARSKNMRRPARSSAGPRSGSQIATPPPVHPVAEQQLAPEMLVLPVLPSAAPRPAPVAPKLTPTPPVRAALESR
jgi:hypothetical protein